jgi:hypothetical protein
VSTKVKALTLIWACVFGFFLLIGPPGMVGLLGPQASTFGHTAFVWLTGLFVVLALFTPLMVILWGVTFVRWVWAVTTPPARIRG